MAWGFYSLGAAHFCSSNSEAAPLDDNKLIQIQQVEVSDCSKEGPCKPVERASESSRALEIARGVGGDSQIFFLFEKPVAQKTWGQTHAREARIKQKLSCHSLGSPSWRRSRQARQGRTQGVGVMASLR